MTRDREPRPSESWDPVGFLIFLVLLVAFGSAILFAARWVLRFFDTVG